MNIDSIKNGYVIDHIQAGKGMEIYELLHLNELDCQVAIITNAKSKIILTTNAFLFFFIVFFITNTSF